jgi:hypothetical protein
VAGAFAVVPQAIAVIAMVAPSRIERTAFRCWFGRTFMLSLGLGPTSGVGLEPVYPRNLSRT